MSNNYIVVFVSTRTKTDDVSYSQMAQEMERLAKRQPGFISMTSVRDSYGVGITVCYWESQEAIVAWKNNVDHAAAQSLGMKSWYSAYSVTIAEVKRSYTSSGG